jgi:hypothetical protein
MGYIVVEWDGAKPGTTVGIMLTKHLIVRAMGAI